MIIHKYCRTEYESYENFYNQLRIHIPENFNFGYDIMDELAKSKPDHRALVWCNDKGEDKTITFGEMKILSDKCANLLAANGIGKGDFVMTTLKRHWQYWVTAVALHKLGAVLVPATFQLTVKDLTYRIAAASIKALITTPDERLMDAIDHAQQETGQTLKLKFVVNGGAREGYIDFDRELSAASDRFVRPLGNDAVTGRDLMLVYFTSGTTGMPKMVAHNFRYPLGHILTAAFWQNLNENDLHFTSADTGWAKTSWGKIYGQWICEAAIFVYDYDSRFQPVDLLEKIQKYRITVFCAPPTIFRFLIKEDISQYDLSSLRHCCIAGEPLNAEVYNKWKENTGLTLREGFGQTETPVLAANFPWVVPKPGSMGKPSPHLTVRLLDEEHRPVEAGEEGEMCIFIGDGIPAGLTICYYKDDARTGECMHDDWYHTGDMAWQDEDGYYWFIGRADDVIKSSGYRIGPFEVESALLEHPAVLETAITAVEDPVRGQVVKATVVLARGYEPSDTLKKQLQDHVKKTTAPYKYPRIVEFVPELPKTLSGKIKRKEIRQNDSGESSSN